MELRYYQQNAVDATYNYLNNRSGNPCIVIPTGGGKTAVIATFCHDVAQKWGGRVLVVSHVKELIGQTVDTLSRIAPELSVGVYAAGLNSRDTNNSVIVSQIHSVYKRAVQLGRFDLIIVDEAHLIPPDGDGMYQTFLRSAKEINSRLRLIGLTATPYRLKSGAICGPDNLLNDISYEVSVKELIEGGYLSHITSKGGSRKVDTSNLKIVRGDFDLSRIDELMDNDYLLSAVIDDIQSKAADRQSILVFCPSKQLAETFVNKFKKATGEEAGVITDNTSDDDRAEMINRFKRTSQTVDIFGTPVAPLRLLANVNVLTTGFDAPNVDCVVMLRPTASPGLYYQQVGRGFRICPGKKDCLVLDYVGNIMRHGPVDVIIPPDAGSENHKGKPAVKECPECNAIIHAGFRECPECGFEFPVRELNTKIYTSAADDAILSGEPEDTTYTVFETNYEIHEKEKDDGTISRTIEIQYRIAIHRVIKEWICPEHIGFAREKFIKWWDKHVCPELQSATITPPQTCEDFMNYVHWGCIAEAKEIVVTKTPGVKHPRVTAGPLKQIPSYQSIQEKIREAQESPSCDYDNNGYDSYNSYDSYNNYNNDGYNYGY